MMSRQLSIVSARVEGMAVTLGYSSTAYKSVFSMMLVMLRINWWVGTVTGLRYVILTNMQVAKCCSFLL